MAGLGRCEWFFLTDVRQRHRAVVPCGDPYPGFWHARDGGLRTDVPRHGFWGPLWRPLLYLDGRSPAPKNRKSRCLRHAVGIGYALDDWFGFDGAGTLFSRDEKQRTLRARRRHDDLVCRYGAHGHAWDSQGGLVLSRRMGEENSAKGGPARF